MHPFLKSRLNTRWVRFVLAVVGVVLTVCLLYALSFGPALKVASRHPGSGQALPEWMFVVYGPLIAIKARMPQALEGLYERYLDLWCPEHVRSDITADSGTRPGCW